MKQKLSVKKDKQITSKAQADAGFIIGAGASVLGLFALLTVEVMQSHNIPREYLPQGLLIALGLVGAIALVGFILVKALAFCLYTVRKKKYLEEKICD